jgi:2-oxoglutarate dehydrogenase complex dehydrogenase (E1) component-like enzyme
VKIPHSSNLWGYIEKYQRDGFRIASSINPLFPNSSARHEFELEHWHLSEMDSLSTYPMDYRVTATHEDCSTFWDLRDHLERCYAQNVAVEFGHVKEEDERLWLHENYEKHMVQEVTETEKVKALQLLMRSE